MNQIADILLFSSTPENLVVMAGVGAAAGLYFFYRGFLLLRRKRLVMNTPASKIRSASMGLVEVSGLASGPYVVRSPLKETDCFYYRSIAWQWKQRGKDSEWVKIAEESLHIPFYIDDGSGKLLIDPRGGEMDLHCDLHQEYNGTALFSGPDMSAAVSSFLARHGADSTKRIKVEEYCIKPKNFLFVLGTLSQNPGLDTSIMPTWAGHSSKPIPAASAVAAGASAETPNLTEGKLSGTDPALPQVVRISGDSAAVPATEMTQQQKIAAALVKAGITSPMAWAAAGVSTQDLAQVRHPAPPVPATSNAEVDQSTPDEAFDMHPPVVLMKGTHEQTFFISWRSQRDVIASLGWKSTLMIWGGPTLTLVCVYILLAHFSWL